MNVKFFSIVSFIAVFQTFSLAQNADPVLMTVGNDKVYLSEFEYLYNKNNAGNVTDKKSLSDYMDMFTVFKLKVEDAKAKGLDTTATFRNELRQYRDQLAQQYFTDPAAEEAIKREAYRFMQEDVDVSHILFLLPQSPTPDDTLALYNKALEALEKLKTEPFEQVAKQYSADRAVQQNGGHFGWMTAFGTIYPFEKAAYSLRVGEVSSPVRSQIGYHIIKLNARRPSPGEVRVAHIIRSFDRENPAKNATSKSLIDSLYLRLEAGDDFVAMAKQYSDDTGSANRGGELPAFGTGKMIPEFEQVAFAMHNAGEISKPFETAYGWHIIKFLEKKPLASYEELKPQIERLIQRDERAKAGRNAFLRQLAAQYKPVLQAENLKDFYPYINLNGVDQPLDTNFFQKVTTFDKPLLVLGEKTFTQADFVKFLAVYYPSNQKTAEAVMSEKAQEFIDRQLIDYEDATLENKHSEFRNLVREYHDGILLFDNSSREVWERSQSDTVGLKKFFAKNRKNYKWDKPHFKGTLVLCKDSATYQQAKQIVKKFKPFEKELINALNNDSVQVVRIQKGLYAQGDNKEVDKQIFGQTADYEPNKDFPYVLILGKNLKFTPENFTDVRGKLATDYQDFLEKEWIQSLHKKYPVKIDNTVLQSVKEN